MRTFSADLSRFTSSGHGTLHDPATAQLRPGERIAVTDDEADTLEAEVIAVGNGSAEVQIFWDKVLHRA